MSVKRALIAQFRQPRGWLGALAGRVMAARPSNRVRNLWTLDRLDPQPGEQILEIGYGPGWALQELCRRAPQTAITGIDHSAVMHGQALLRNRSAVAEGRLVLKVGTIDVLDCAPFDKVYSVNVIQFWDAPVATMRRCLELLKPGGVLLATYQPRTGDRSDDGARRFAQGVHRHLTDVGFIDAAIEERPIGGVLTVLISAAKPR